MLPSFSDHDSIDDHANHDANVDSTTQHRMAANSPRNFVNNRCLTDQHRVPAAPAIDTTAFSEQQRFLLHATRKEPPGWGDGGRQQKARHKPISVPADLIPHERKILTTILIQQLKKLSKHMLSRAAIEENLQEAVDNGGIANWSDTLLSFFPVEYDRFIAVCEGLGITLHISMQSALINKCRLHAYVSLCMLIMLSQ
jgi:hypothetical protein